MAVASCPKARIKFPRNAMLVCKNEAIQMTILSGNLTQVAVPQTIKFEEVFETLILAVLSCRFTHSFWDCRCNLVPQEKLKCIKPPFACCNNQLVDNIC